MKKRIVIMGLMSRCPISGVIWQHLHYIVGFQRLGFEVTYLEQTSSWPYDSRRMTVTDDPSCALESTRSLAGEHGFAWGFRAAYRTPAETFGCSSTEFDAVLRDADAVINLCGAQEMTDQLRLCRCLVYLESDPGVEQIKLAEGDAGTLDYLKAHHFHFSFGELLGSDDCILPRHEAIDWRPTRQPVVADFWTGAAVPSGRSPFRFTTVANWETKGKDITWRDERYLWSKTPAFLAYNRLPKLIHAAVPLEWELASDLSSDPASQKLFLDQGWKLQPPRQLSSDPAVYRRYVLDSDAEWTVAKDQYVRLKTGWFSDRSACYLAAGKPVITQQTGFGSLLPEGEGLFGFQDEKDVQRAVDRILSDPQRHSKAAREIGREYFDAEKICANIAAQIGI